MLSYVDMVVRQFLGVGDFFSSPDCRIVAQPLYFSRKQQR